MGIEARPEEDEIGAVVSERGIAAAEGGTECSKESRSRAGEIGFGLWWNMIITSMLLGTRRKKGDVSTKDGRVAVAVEIGSYDASEG